MAEARRLSTPKNVAADCVLPGADRAGLPDHIQPCECDAHTGVCEECEFHVVIGPTLVEYGHARAKNKDPGQRRRCPHRPTGTDPRRSQQTSGGRSR